MNNKKILGRLYNDYTKKFLNKIIIAAFFQYLLQEAHHPLLGY